MATETTSSRLHQLALLGVIFLIIVSLFAIALLLSELVFRRPVAALPSSPSPVRVVEQVAPPPATPTTRPTLPPLVVATGAPAASPTLAPSPLPTLQPIEPTAVIIVLPAVQGPAEPTPATVDPTAPASAPDPAPATAAIELRVSCPAQGCAIQGLQTVVQWQDGLGAWHDVPGWAGALGSDGRLLYGVEQKDLGTGPFRWAVVGACPCGPLAVSGAFHLPLRVGETLLVEVVLGG